MKKRNSFKSALNSTLIITLATIGMFGCGQNEIDPARKIKRAPSSQEKTGFIVQGASESDVQTMLEQEASASVRVINKKHMLYEVYGLNKADLSNYLPKAEISKNIYFKSNAVVKKTWKDQALEVLTEKNSPFAGCKEGILPPLPAISLAANPNKHLGSRNVYITLGENMSFSSVLSKPNAQGPSDIETTWVVIPPTGSKKEVEFYKTQELTYVPDSMGEYNVLLIAKDKNGVCDGTGTTLGVTFNRPYEEPNFPLSQLEGALELDPFTHLTGIRAQEAWGLSTGQGVKVAILDSGVNYRHPLLVHKMVKNEGEIPNNNLDDDGNGLVDDYIGYDFINDDGHPFDDQGHGSHVSGLAAGNNFGMAKEAEIIAIKVLDVTGSGDVGTSAGAIFYAVDQGAQVLNLSFGNYNPPHPAMIMAMNYAQRNGVVVVAAAGNGHPLTGIPVDNDRTPNFPSSYPNTNIVSVAAYGGGELLAPYSNYGKNSVDVVAPGGAEPGDTMYSTYIDNPAEVPFIGMSGTSMAAPVVTGIVAQMLSVNPQLTPSQVREILIKSGAEIPALKEFVQSGRYLDAHEAVKSAQQASLTAFNL